MNPENQQQPSLQNPPQPPQQTRPGGGITLQPSEGFAEEMQGSQPQPQPQPYQPTPQPMPQQYVEQPAEQPAEQPQLVQPEAPAPQQPTMFAQPTPLQTVQSGGAIGSVPGGVYERPAPTRSFFASKAFIFGGIGGVLLLVVAALVTLILTGTISLTGFKTVDYAGTGGGQYRLTYYFDHTVKDVNGSSSLVSTVSKDGKLPLTISIGESEDSGSYRFGENCSQLEKVFEVQNNKLDQTISVCTVEAPGEEAPGVYIAEFIHDGKNHLVVVAQDYSSMRMSDMQDRETALTVFGLQPYENDIKKIIASIEVK